MSDRIEELRAAFDAAANAFEAASEAAVAAFDAAADAAYEAAKAAIETLEREVRGSVKEQRLPASRSQPGAAQEGADE